MGRGHEAGRQEEALGKWWRRRSRRRRRRRRTHSLCPEVIPKVSTLFLGHGEIGSPHAGGVLRRRRQETKTG